MFGLPHGVIQVERPDTAVSTYEVRKGVRHGKETFRIDAASITNATWQPGHNTGANFYTARPVNNEDAFYNADGTFGTADDYNWTEFM